MRAFYVPISDPANPSKTLLGEISIFIGFDGSSSTGVGVSADVKSKPFNFVDGHWHHVVWTWQGMHHRLYIDGQLSTELTAVSPLPTTMPPNTMYVGTDGGGSADATIDEFALYNFAMTPSDVAATFNRSVSGPFTSTDSHGFDIQSKWGPSVGKLHLMADAGNDFESSASCME